MKKRSGVTLHYAIMTGGFWMAFCVAVQYAAVYLQGVGFNNQELGLIMALGSVGGALLGPALGALIDRKKTVRHSTVAYILLAIQIALLLLLWLVPVRGWLCAACYVTFLTVMMPVNAVNLDLCVKLEHAKTGLNFGIARAMGSFAFVLLSPLLGVLTENWGHGMVPMAGICVAVIQLTGNWLVDRDLRSAEALCPQEERKEKKKPSSLITFVKENALFCVMLLGTVFLFTAHNIDGNFLINEIRALGGGTAIMGYVAAFTAIVAVPVMLFSSRLPKRYPRVWYIRLSFVFFTLKLLAYTLAPNIPLFFAARTLQAPSYALYTVLSVGYVDSIVARKDSAKAQSLIYAMTSVGSVLASLLGGHLFETAGVRPAMWAATGMAAVGTVIALRGTLTPKKKTGTEK